MSRIYFAQLSILATGLAIANITSGGRWQRSNGSDNLPSRPGSALVGFVNPSTNPPTPLQDVAIVLNDARVGTLQNPGSPLPASSLLGIVNPDALGLGDPAFFDVFFTGPTNDFSADSFFDVFLQASDPGTGQPAAMTHGTVKFFNEKKGFGMVVSGQFPGQPEYDYSLLGQINPAQPGLSFANAPVVVGGGPAANSFFDIFTELRFDGPGTINPSVPLFEITLTGVPEPATVVLATIGMAALSVAASKRRRSA